jgi:hypothetical protein
MWRQDYATEITRKLMNFLEFIDGFFALAAKKLTEAKPNGKVLLPYRQGFNDK